MDFEIKTVSFGGYDKKATETFILEQQKKYEDEIAQLREDATKLSEAVKGLQQMREANMTESRSTIDSLKTANEEMQAELGRLKEELEGYKMRESESASRYESISRTLLAARENADELTRKTNYECETKISETNAQCSSMIEETTSQCEQLKNVTETECDRLMAETQNACTQLKNATETECDRLMSTTQSSCQEQKETTYAECESLRRRTKAETEQLRTETQDYCDNLKAQTEAGCARLKEDTISECDKMKADTREEIRQNRTIVKKEFDSIGGFVAQLQEALVNVNSAVEETKKITDSAFQDLHPSVS